MSDPNKENDLDLSAFDDFDDLNLDSLDSETPDASDSASTAALVDTTNHNAGDGLDLAGFDDDEAPTELADDSFSSADEFDSGGFEDAFTEDFGNEPHAEPVADFDSDILSGFSEPVEDVEETVQMPTGAMPPLSADTFEPEETDAKGKKKKAKKEKPPKEPKAKKEKKPKEPKAPKVKKEKKVKPPRDPNAPGLEIEDMFALGSAALLAVAVLGGAFLSLSISFVLTILVLLFGAIIVAVPLLLFKFKDKRSVYDVMLGVATIAFTVSALLVLTAWTRYW